MNMKKIVKALTSKGYRIKTGFGEAGPYVKAHTNKGTLFALVPIDDESDDDFADFVMAEIDTANGLLVPVPRRMPEPLTFSEEERLFGGPTWEAVTPREARRRMGKDTIGYEGEFYG